VLGVDRVVLVKRVGQRLHVVHGHHFVAAEVQRAGVVRPHQSQDALHAVVHEAKRTGLLAVTYTHNTETSTPSPHERRHGDEGEDEDQGEGEDKTRGRKDELKRSDVGHQVRQLTRSLTLTHSLTQFTHSASQSVSLTVKLQSVTHSESCRVLLVTRSLVR
jgi:hypothetical protein